MSTKAAAAANTADVIWLCRRLASALQGGASILCALDAVAQDVPASLRRPLSSIRDCVCSGGRMSDTMIRLRWPSFVWEMVKNGESRADLGPTLTLIADRLEAERAILAPKNRKLYAYALCFGRLGAMLEAGVPILAALETAAQAVPRSRAHDTFMAARDAVRQGADLSYAIQRLAPDLPDMTLEIIRDAERDGRLGEALPIVADYVLDEAAKGPARGREQATQDA